MHSEQLTARLQNITPHRICVIKPGELSEVIQALPVLYALNACYPDASISWVINRRFSNLLETHPLIDDLHFYDRLGGIRTSWQLLKELRAGHFDLVIDLEGLLRSGVMSVATGSPLRIGLESAREGAKYTTHFNLQNTKRRVPAYQRYWRLAEVLGKGNLQSAPGIRVRTDDELWVQAHLPDSESRVLAIQAGAKWATRRWPATKFAAIAARAVREYGFRLAIIGGPHEAALGSAIAAIIRERLPQSLAETPIYNFVGQTTLRQLAALLRSVDYVLTNDSGPMHLADAMGTAVCATFLCSSPQQSGLRGGQHRTAECKLSCAGSHRKRCPFSGQRKMQCKDELTVERVWNAFTDLVDQPRLLKFAA